MVNDRQSGPSILRPARVLGVSALVAGGFALVMWLFLIAVFIGPIIFWLAWNVLDFGAAVGLPELGFWATLLATLFLTVGGFGKVVITAFVFIIDPAWFQAEATVRWPEPTLKNFIAVMLLAGLASFAHSRRRARQRKPGRTSIIDVEAR